MKRGLVNERIKSFESIFLDEIIVLQRALFPSEVHKLDFVTGNVPIFGKLEFYEHFWLRSPVNLK